MLQALFFESLVWLDLGLNPSLPGHWRTSCQCPKITWLVILAKWKLNKKKNPSNNLTKVNILLDEILKIICKNLNCVFLHGSQRIYFNVKLIVKIWLNNFSVHYNIIYKEDLIIKFRVQRNKAPFKFCACSHVCMRVYMRLRVA